MKHLPIRLLCGLLCLATLLLGAPARAAETKPADTAHAMPLAIDIPPWFTEGFLDFKEELASAGKAGKQLMVYVGQDGCPYCRELMQSNFSQKPIADKTRAHFVAIALNLWGDRELSWTDGRTLSEKALARELKVQFTPTLLFLDARGQVRLRLNGYQPPQRFSAVLDYLIGQHDQRETLAQFLARSPAAPARPQLTDEAFFMPAPLDLRRRTGARPLAVLFETRHCRACDEMHDQGFKRPEVRTQLARFDVARLALSDGAEIVTPADRRQRADAWARELGVSFTPTLVFFDAGGAEVFRLDGYTRPFHLASAFEYVADGGYRREPEFQRYLRDKADRLRARGQPVELWK